MKEPLTIPSIMLDEMGPFSVKPMLEAIKSVTEQETGRPHEWRYLINRDAIQLVPEGYNG